MSNEIKIPKKYVTYDYSIFKFIECNRNVSHIKKLKESIESIDLTMHYPIIVNDNMEIVDGQHRFEVCKLLGKPIYYEYINSKDYIKGMQKLNVASRVWRQEDYLHFYCKLGNKVYIDFERFMNTNGFKLSNALLIFGDAKINAQSFKSGKLKDFSANTQKTVDFLLSVKGLLPKDLWEFRPFVAALNQYLKTIDDRKISKLKKNIIAIPKFARAEDFTNAMSNLVR